VNSRLFPVAAATTLAASGAVVALDQAPASAHQSSRGDVFFTDAMYVIGTKCSTPGSVRGGAVRGLQTFLWASGSYGNPASTGTKNQIDGVWGPSTEDAVRVFQKRHHIAVDGCVAHDTWHQIQRHFDDVTASETSKTRRLEFVEARVSEWFPGVQPPTIQAVKEGGDSFGCHWFRVPGAGYHTYTENSVAPLDNEGLCWTHTETCTCGPEHIGFRPTFSTK
jgi:peptidoglycan hydrolase-like protein with peptidoglycan-binding domain